MVRRTLRVTRPVGERLQVLVRQAYPRGSRYRPAACETIPGLSLADARQFGDYIRQVRAGRHQQPPPDTAWALGSALGVLSGKQWINPITFLFACGHYGLVAELFVRVAPRFERHELSELARTLRTVLHGDPSPQYADVRDDLAIQEARNWEASFHAAERYDRRVWSLDGQTYAKFAESWRLLAASLSHKRHSRSPHAAVAASQLIADAAEYPVPDRDRFVSLIIADAIAA
jgi:hypothetical protein